MKHAKDDKGRTPLDLAKTVKLWCHFWAVKPANMGELSVSMGKRRSGVCP